MSKHVTVPTTRGHQIITGANENACFGGIPVLIEIPGSNQTSHISRTPDAFAAFQKEPQLGGMRRARLTCGEGSITIFPEPGGPKSELSF